MRFVVAALIVLTLVATPARAGDEAEVPFELNAAANAWARARSAGDDATARKIASALQHDPARVGALLLEAAPDAESALRHLRRWRADAAGHRDLGGLDRLIERVAAAGGAVRDRERTITARIAAMQRARDAAAAEHVLASVSEALEEPGSLAAWRLRHHYAERLQRLGLLEDAEARFLDAAAYARASHMLTSRAHSLVGAARAAHQRGARQRALDSASEALAVARAAGHPREICRSATLLTSLLFWAGQRAEALATLRANEPTEDWLDLRDRYAFYLVAFNVRSVSNLPERTLATAHDLWAVATRVDQPGARAHALRSMGHALEAVGRIPEAIERYQEALALDLTSVPRVERLVRIGLSGIWSELGRYAEAETEARRALALSRKLGKRADEAQDLLHLAKAQAGLGRFAEALASARAGLRIQEEADDPVRHSEAQRIVASLLWRGGSREEAYALLERARAAAESRRDGLGEAFALWGTGAYRMQAGDAAAALAAADRGSALLHARHAFQERFARLRCAALYALGRHGECIEEARRSIALRRDLLGGMPEGDTRFGQRHLANAAAYGLRSSVALGRASDAFAFIEAGRAMQLNAALHSVRSESLAALPATLRAREESTRSAVEDARSNVVRLAQQADVPALDMRRAEQVLEAAWKARERAVTEIERVSRRAALAVGGRSIGLDEFRRMLASDEICIAFHDAGESIVALGVGREVLTLADLGARASIERALEDWRRAVSTPGADDRPLARKLHVRLLAPLAATLQGVRRILIAPAGALAAIPLGALVTSDGRRVIEDHEVLYVPSATSYAILRAGANDTRRTGIVVVAAPDYAGTGLVSLPHAGKEAAGVEGPFDPSVRTRLTGAEAGVAALRRACEERSGGLRALHVAAHAFVDGLNPARSGIALTGGEMLTVDTVRRMRLECDLVTLSCCDSARGTPTAGEGQRGLVRAFFIAGARRVVASCWRVSDEHTPAFMARFYEAWAGQQREVVSALRLAQLERLAAGGPLAHPSAWASFVAWGLP